MSEWIEVCATGDIDEEDLIRWDRGGRSFAIYNTEKGFFATDGYCTHERQHLADGLVTGTVTQLPLPQRDGAVPCTVIEGPLHQGRFDIVTGKALRPPVRIALVTYPVKVEDGTVFIRL